MAQIFVHKNNFKMAQQSLEVGLSYNFAVRDHPLYFLIRARILLRSGKVESAVNQLQAAVKLPLFANKNEHRSGTLASLQQLALTDDDRIVIYLELIDAMHANNDNSGADATITEALNRFKNTGHENRLVLARADSALARNDPDAALKLLEAVKPDEQAYFAARRKLAEVYLHHKKDKRQFAIVYKELVEKNPTPQAFVLLGDAYMSIQEPERAIEVYESALKRDPKDHTLARKIGRAYVQAHLYNKALNYYEAALKTGQQNFLRSVNSITNICKTSNMHTYCGCRMDLAELLFRLKNFDKCERVLRQGLEKSAAAADSSAMYDEVRLLALLSRLHVARGDPPAKGMQELLRAKQLQTKLVQQTGANGASLAGIDLQQQKAYAKQLCVELAEYAESRREMDNAIVLYKEALAYAEADTKVMLALAHAYLSTGKTDECNNQCQMLLKIDPNNDDATLLVADNLYQKNETNAALTHYERLLEHDPNQYSALSHLVELCWRTGNLARAERALDCAAAAHSRATLDPGYNYCRATFDWRTGDLNAALQHFGRARRDEVWGEAATLAIIEICLNPDNEIIGGEAMGQTVADDVQNQTSEEKEVGIKTAEKFLKELRQSHSSGAVKNAGNFNYKLMENFILLAGKTKAGAEAALQEFLNMIGNEPDETVDASAILGAARAQMLLKQAAKAKPLLKRVSTRTWTLEQAASLEQCWLLLADMHINAAKFDQANLLLDNVLKHNASCIKAYECLGLIKEKESIWLAAGEQYAKAWAVGKRSHASIGYKLAHCELRAKRYFQAIDACNRVLELHPNYPNIRKDVLVKARSQLRN